MDNYDCIKTYTFPIAPDGEGRLKIAGPAIDSEQNATSGESDQYAQRRELKELRARLRVAAGRLVDFRTRVYMDDHGVKDYAQAMRVVLAADQEMKVNYILGVTLREYERQST